MEHITKTDSKPNDGRLFTILMIIFVQIVGASMILPILPLYAQRHFDLSPQVITLLGSSFFAAQFLAGPYLGRWSDQYGRLPILIVSQIGTVISFVMLAFAGSFEVLFAARILDGITGGNIIVAQAYVTDITPREKRTQALGYTFAAFGLGFIFGPALGGILSAIFGDRIPFLIAAFAALATVILTWYTLDETVTPEQRTKNRIAGKGGLAPHDVLHNFPLLLVLGIAFGGQFAFGLMQATFALFGEAVLFEGASEESTNLGIGIILAGFGVGQFCTQLFLLKRFVAHFEEPLVVFIGSVLRGTSMVVIAIISSPLLGAIGSVVFAIGAGLMMPPLQSLATATVSDEVRGGILGLYQSTMSLGIILATALGGTLFALNPTVPYWLGGGIFAGLLIPCTFLVRWSRGHLVAVAEGSD